MKKTLEYPGSWFALLLAGAASIGCGEEADRPSDVHTLRVLAVRSETPYAKPSSTVELTMLAYDGAKGARLENGTTRPNSTLWIGGCVNPPGDSYAACMPYLHGVVNQLDDDDLMNTKVPSDLPAGTIGWGERFGVAVPADIITSRPVARGVAYPYGVEMTFFARCGGVLRRLQVGSSEFPLGCFEPSTGEQLGRDDFEFGYYPLFAFEGLENQNPELADLTFAATEPGATCSESEPCIQGHHCGSGGGCIPVVERCTKADQDDCASYRLDITVPRSSVERAARAQVSESDAISESLWVSYYANAGSFEQDARIINDPHTGWSDDVAGKWRANVTEPREVRLWAVVRDNRNGVAWGWRDLWVE